MKDGKLIAFFIRSRVRLRPQYFKIPQYTPQALLCNFRYSQPLHEPSTPTCS